MGKLLDNPALLVILLLIVVLLFGAKRLPDAARGIGRSLRIFKAETEGLRSDHPATPATPTTAVVAPTPIPAPAPIAAPPAAADAPRYLVDPATGERVLATPVQAPQQTPPTP